MPEDNCNEIITWGDVLRKQEDCDSHPWMGFRAKALFSFTSEQMSSKGKFQQADGDLPFPRGQADRFWPFLPWSLQGQVTVATSMKRSCWSSAPLESSFPAKEKKQDKLHSSSVCRVGSVC